MTGLFCAGGPEALPASHQVHMMRVEATLSALGRTLARVHSLTREQFSELGLGTLVPDHLEIPVKPAVLVEKLTVNHALDRPIDAAESLRPPFDHLSRRELLENLTSRLELVVSRSDDPVVLQGAPVLENLLFTGTEVCGFSDWRSASIGDRHLDLAVAARDVIERCGGAALPVVLDAYGIDRVDPIRLDWYSQAIELL